jgi:hypothetical protein
MSAVTDRGDVADLITGSVCLGGYQRFARDAEPRDAKLVAVTKRIPFFEAASMFVRAWAV